MDTTVRQKPLVRCGSAILFWVALLSRWCITAADRLSATYDEPTYIELGLAHWRTGSAGALRTGHPHVAGRRPDPSPLLVRTMSRREPRRGGRLRSTPPLGTCRQPAFLVAAPELCPAGPGETSGAGTGPAGRGPACSYLPSSPSAALATTDIAVTACLLALIYHFRTARAAMWLRCWSAFPVVRRRCAGPRSGSCSAASAWLWSRWSVGWALAPESGITGWA